MRNFQIFVRESLFPRTRSEGGDGLLPLAIVGQLDNYTAFDAIQRHNAVGSWKLTVPAGNPQSRMLTPGRGIIVFQEGETEPLFSGPIRQIEKSWDPEAAGAGTVDVSGVDDNYLLSERLAWVNPTADIHLAAVLEYWKANPSWLNVAEVLRNLLLVNAQNNPARKLERLFIPSAEATANFMADDTSRVTRLRYDQMDQLVSLLSAVYGFRIQFIWHKNPASVASNGDLDATGPGILLKLEPINDLTNDIQFGAELGNLRGYKYMVRAPEATRLVIATQNRTWREFVKQPVKDSAGASTGGYTETWEDKTGPERWYGYFTNDEYDPEWWGDAVDTPADKQHTLDWASRGFSTTETEWGVTAERYKDRQDINWQWLPDSGKAPGTSLDPPVWSSQYRAIQDEVDAFNLNSGPVASISIDPIETDLTMFGKDYGLGDIVRVYIDGEIRDEIVREAHLTSDASDGPRIKPTIGTFGTGETPYLYSSIRDLWGRVTGVEARESLIQLVDVPISDFLIKKAA
ncbi:Gp37-like protein [Streptosporangium subroseum]|uniref:Gp37-like protein n=1 Tax=Streptosporangium subroseum TaxID=106412 RepID=UPI00308BBD8F|nr:siphovirus ReqiPepy6 Gp37-like family protein [Streptosporangium subroseum]